MDCGGGQTRPKDMQGHLVCSFIHVSQREKNNNDNCTAYFFLLKCIYIFFTGALFCALLLNFGSFWL